MLKNDINLIQSGHLEKVQKGEEVCFVSPVLLIVEKISVEIALISRELNDCCIKTKPQMPSKEDLLNQISTETRKVQNKPLWISKIDLEYEYSQLKSSERTSKNCNFVKTRGIMNGY